MSRLALLALVFALARQAVSSPIVPGDRLHLRSNEKIVVRQTASSSTSPSLSISTSTSLSSPEASATTTFESEFDFTTPIPSPTTVADVNSTTTSNFTFPTGTAVTSVPISSEAANISWSTTQMMLNGTISTATVVNATMDGQTVTRTIFTPVESTFASSTLLPAYYPHHQLSTAEIAGIIGAVMSLLTIIAVAIFVARRKGLSKPAFLSLNRHSSTKKSRKRRGHRRLSDEDSLAFANAPPEYNEHGEMTEVEQYPSAIMISQSVLGSSSSSVINPQGRFAQSGPVSIAGTSTPPIISAPAPAYIPPPMLSRSFVSIPSLTTPSFSNSRSTLSFPPPPPSPPASTPSRRISTRRPASVTSETSEASQRSVPPPYSATTDESNPFHD
ncbi:hypothetical protein SISSUDRAFT_1124921 [Sistotremastrum suecicum HHB10207 ss-3]|uniref:Mid2 domain-containing protein n=1 Tax=Sistotremastrum suecicum HHB10207 ss-3 TaxID=1314776 RepID=A0A166I581_9AGAM|nr:hypothetical protein SISSUDRAFT_1124921 [Sistotremastrum suecicum HHB10207 ss-3]